MMICAPLFAGMDMGAVWVDKSGKDIKNETMKWMIYAVWCFWLVMIFRSLFR
jgi:hypothetical protein